MSPFRLIRLTLFKNYGTIWTYLRHKESLQVQLKEEILQILEENKGSYISGEQIAEKLFVSRNAVWKTVDSLKKDGYQIDAVRKRGYCLSKNSNIFSVQAISAMLPASLRKFINIEIKASTGSTNTDLKKTAENGAPEGAILIALEQTGGKGRLGRNFYSPKQTGLYMSILLRPAFPAEKSLYITTCAATAVSEAIDCTANVKSAIKWVNDVYLDGKKVSGILTEASLDFESGGLHYAVCGIGVNISTDFFPDDLGSIAGAISDGKKDLRAKLAAEIITRFFNYYNALEKLEFLGEYRRRSFLIGKRIEFIMNNKNFSGTAEDIDEKARLVVKLDNGERMALSSGEVQLKKGDIIR